MQTKTEASRHVALGMAVVTMLLVLAAPAKGVTLVSLWEQVSNLISIKTPLDDLISGTWRQLDSRVAAEQRLNQEFETGKQRLNAAFGAQRLLICNFPGLNGDQRAQCINKLNDSYQARLSELRQRLEGERAKLVSRYEMF